MCRCREAQDVRERPSLKPQISNSPTAQYLANSPICAFDSPIGQEQLGHKDLRTTQIHTLVTNRGRLAVQSPLGSVLAASGARRTREDVEKG